MIKITKLNGKEAVINCELIELLEANPDTTITMSTGKIIIAKESVDEIINRVVAYKQMFLSVDYRYARQ